MIDSQLLLNKNNKVCLVAIYALIASFVCFFTMKVNLLEIVVFIVVIQEHVTCLYHAMSIS